jgi:hypothetical protein
MLAWPSSSSASRYRPSRRSATVSATSSARIDVSPKAPALAACFVVSGFVNETRDEPLPASGLDSHWKRGAQSRLAAGQAVDGGVVGGDCNRDRSVGAAGP